MSTHYSNIINYAIEELRVNNFDFQQVIDYLKELLAKDRYPLWDQIKELTIRFEIFSPDYDAIYEFHNQKMIKSHEVEAVIDRVTMQLTNAITSLVNKLNYTINYYPLFKESISMKQYTSFQKEEGKRSKRNEYIQMEFKTKKLTIEDVISFMQLWYLDEFCFSEQIHVKAYVQYKNFNKKQIILNRNLKKKSLVQLGDFLSADDLGLTIELLGHENYHKIFNSYVFPDGFKNHAEITLDVANEGRIPSKRRTISVNGIKMRFHEIITKYIPHKEFRRIIQQNKIAGIYISTKSTNDELLYLLIDIDVPSLFFNIFSKEKVWELILNLGEAINRTAVYFGLPPFKIIFSGKKGIHLLNGIKKNVIMDIENYVNLPELYDYNVLPGMKTMKKETKSSLNDKFKFAKSLLQSLLLYTVYKGNIVIPSEIRYKLRISHPYRLFVLTPDTKNCLSILLDCSSQSRGVFRFFSPHPLSKKVSIPIYDFKAKKLCDRYRKFKNVLEDANIENVIEQFNDNNITLYLQTPQQISRSQVRELLRPDKLFPAFAILLRFGTTYAIERSPYSFSFWYRFYELKRFYNYIDNLVQSFEREDLTHFCAYIENMGAKLKIQNIKRIITNLRIHLLHKKISYPIFKQNLKILYYIEFFISLKRNIFHKLNENQLNELFQNEMQFANFLNQSKHLFQIAIYTISNHLILKDHKKFSKQQKNSIILLDKKLDSLIDYLEELKDDKGEISWKELMICIIYLVSELDSSATEFVRSFYNIETKKEGI